MPKDGWSLQLQTEPGEEVRAEFVKDGDGLTVRAQVPDAPDGVMAEHRLAADGTLLRSEVPRGLVGEDGQSLAAILTLNRAPDSDPPVDSGSGRRVRQRGPDALGRHHDAQRELG